MESKAGGCRRRDIIVQYAIQTQVGTSFEGRTAPVAALILALFRVFGDPWLLLRKSRRGADPTAPSLEAILTALQLVLLIKNIEKLFCVS